MRFLDDTTTENIKHSLRRKLREVEKNTSRNDGWGSISSFLSDWRRRERRDGNEAPSTQPAVISTATSHFLLLRTAEMKNNMQTEMLLT